MNTMPISLRHLLLRELCDEHNRRPFSERSKITILYSTHVMQTLVLLFALSLGAFAQDATSCPLEINALKLSHSVLGVGTVGGHSQPSGKLSFTYNNISGKDIQSITLRANGNKMVGPPGGPILGSSRTVDVNGPMPANSSKKLSVKLPEGNWYAFELEQVRFSNGDTWSNDGKAECVVNANSGVRR